MGRFTTVVHAGENIQFKTGWDYCHTYKVGDNIDWKPDPSYPGEHIDGVYDACTLDDSYWVIVKDCIIVAVEPFVGPDLLRLEQKYGITRPDPKLWTKAQWKASRARRAKADAEYKAWAKVHGDDPVGYYVHKIVRGKSFAETILPARKV